MYHPKISICIPAYKKPEYVVRCIESVAKQDYKNVEIIISDDSPGEDIKQAIQTYTNHLDIRYYHNQPALKSPKNWNAAMDRATGDLLVLMHQDDWYHSETALSTFIKIFETRDPDFAFCQNTAIEENGERVILQAIPSLLSTMAQRPNHLLLAQVIGPPSNVMIKRSIQLRYDERFIWLVDVDYFSRILKAGYRYQYIEQHLVSIGLHEDQTTVFCRENSDIIFKENIWFAEKIGEKAFVDIKIYDYYWRLLRNYKIRTDNDLAANQIKFEEVPGVIKGMLQSQKRISLSLLQNGFISKFTMTLNYIFWRVRRK